ncbi:MAG: ABC transporter ATP-binding protein [Oscillospiraceae bacterium]|nr:ABC transporter ATP-binding protein [Oscillospiraceae bacterium]
MTPILQIDSLCKSYEDFSLQNISFALPQGCIMGLVGQNGAGKSTTLKAILGLVRPDSGSVKLFGQELRENEGQIKEQIGVVFDSMNLPEMLRGKDVGKVLGPLYQSWDQTAFNGYLERFSLPKNKLIKDYSRGMKMKVAIAAALSHGAKLLLLDEATGGLDPIVRDEILDILLEFMQDPTHGILFSSHITGDLEKIADYVTFIHEGQVRFSQPKDELLDSYAVVKCSPQQLASIDPAALISVRSHQYGTEALVRRDAVWADAVAERPTIEDMMLFIARGNR